MDYDFIAQRTLTSTSDLKLEIKISLARPTFNEDRRDYQCVYRIIGAGQNITRFAAGVDEIQALWLSFGTISAEIAYIERITGHSFVFNGENAWFSTP